MKLLSKFSRLLPKRLRKSEEVFEEYFETPDVPEPPKDKQHDKNDKKINLKVTLLAAVITALGVLGVYKYVIAPANSIPATPVSVQNEQAQRSDADKKEAAASSGRGAMINPFIDKSSIKELMPGINGDLPVIDGSHQAGRTTANNLPPVPVIPQMPRSNTQMSMPMPQAQAALPQSPAKTRDNASIQGIITSADGDNVAIMGDGTVVSAGESYNDNRISYIGGDGIHFANGSSIRFSE